ncbi:YheC/YheD family protein [Shouchella clausii]
MKVGMLRYQDSPSGLARPIAYVCSHYGIDFFYFSHNDIDLDRGKINGLFLQEGNWVRKQTDFPDIIDNAPPRKRDEPLYKLLEQKCFLTTKRIGSKQAIYNMLSDNGGFEDILIPFQILQSIDDVERSLNEYGTIVLKPSRGNRGNDVYTLKKKENNYILSTDDKTSTYDWYEFRDVVNQTFLKRLFIIQPYIESKTKEGHPFDVRIHVRKNRTGDWKIVKIYPRIGIGHALTSNISQGGGISNINAFLKSQFSENWNQVKDKLNQLGKQFPPSFQKFYDFPIDALGIDLGIDPNGKLGLFEVNTFPGAQFFEIEDAEIRVQYYIHCAQNMQVGSAI